MIDPDKNSEPLLLETANIAVLGAQAREQKAYELVRQAEEHLQRCLDHWNKAQTELFMLRKPEA